MTLAWSRRRTWLAAALALTILAAVWAKPEDRLVPASPGHRHQAGLDPAAGAVPQAPAARAVAPPARPVENLFRSQTWHESKPVSRMPVAVLPPSAPVAPPLPFTYVGRLDSEGELTVFFLSHGERLHTVSSGDVIEGMYRVGSIAGGRLELMYLPLTLTQSLLIGNEP